jgi:hypothetical protein
MLCEFCFKLKYVSSAEVKKLFKTHVPKVTFSLKGRGDYTKDKTPL